MKLGLKCSSCLLITLFLLLGLPKLLPADEMTLNLVSRVLESFDDPNVRTWAFIPSKFGYDLEGKSLFEKRYVDTWPEALFGKNRNKENLKVLGVHGSFLRKGYNYLEIVPGKGEGADFTPEPILFPGRAGILDLWVWGSNHNYYLEVHVRDYQGVFHVLPLGSIQHQGWKNLSVKIPGSIPQSWQYLPESRQMALTKFVLWTRPQEKVDDFYLYIDQIKVLTDLFEKRFDGDDLAEVDKVKEVWGSVKE